MPTTRRAAHQVVAVTRFELRYHRREFLTWLGAIVFLLLTFAFTASGAVELVRGRGLVPRTAPLVIAQAMAGVTAFGQVITAMIAATAVLRDEAARTRALLFATPLTRVAYLGGRFLGAVAVMLVVYLAIPAGAMFGAVVADGVGALDLAAYARPWALLVAPNVLVVTALLFAAGTRGGGLMAILLASLGLVALWQTGTSLAAAGDARWALLDPFGNAALTAATAGWSDAERAARHVPWTGLLAADRLLWLAAGVAAAVWTLATHRLTLAPPTARGGAARRATARTAAPHGRRVPRPAAPPGWARQALAVARFTAGWLLRERGFRVLAGLALVNAAANAWRAAGGGPAAVLEAVHGHSRIFLILVATIYAGELVWRERDVRAAALADALPTRTGPVVAGKVLGVLLAGAVLAGALLLAGLVVQARAPGGLALGPSLRWALGVVLPTLAQLTLLSLAVHALVQRKIVAHLLLVTGWAVTVTVATVGGEWRAVRLALAPGGPDGGPAAWAWSGALAVVWLLIARLRWRRGA